MTFCSSPVSGACEAAGWATASRTLWRAARPVARPAAKRRAPAMVKRVGIGMSGGAAGSVRGEGPRPVASTSYTVLRLPYGVPEGADGSRSDRLDGRTRYSVQVPGTALCSLHGETYEAFWARMP